MALSITPGKSDLSPREWLSKQDPPLAKYPSRGQFSAAGKAALAEALAAGMTFSEPVKAAAAPKAPAAPAKTPEQVKAEKRAKLLAALDALDEAATVEAAADAAPQVNTVEDTAALVEPAPVEAEFIVTEPREPVVLPVLYASEDGESTDSPVGFDMCYRPGCFQTVERCQCKQGPKAPANLLTIG
jgi:hypothetical protein